MQRDLFIGGVATVEIYDGSDLFATAKTLMDSSIQVAVSEQDVRGGQGNKLFGKYFHTSKFDSKLTDTMFRLEYLAKNVGSIITVGANLFTEESVVLGSGGTGTVVGTPVAVDSYGTIGWAALVGDNSYQTVTFTGSNFTFVGGTSGQTVCVKYVAYDVAGRELIVGANIVPSTVKLVMKAQLFSGDSLEQATRAGFVQIIVPRFILSGNQSISMTSSGVANTPLEGSALAVSSNTCTGDAYYAIIDEFISNATWYEDVTSIVIAGNEIDLAVAGTEQLTVYALHTNAAPSIAPIADLTFSSSDVAKATVGIHSGIVTGVATGTAYITANITAKPSIETSAKVVVS